MALILASANTRQHLRETRWSVGEVQKIFSFEHARRNPLWRLRDGGDTIR